MVKSDRCVAVLSGDKMVDLRKVRRVIFPLMISKAHGVDPLVLVESSYCVFFACIAYTM